MSISTRWVVLAVVVLQLQACFLFKKKATGNGSDNGDGGTESGTCPNDSEPTSCAADGGTTFTCGTQTCCANGELACISSQCESDLLWTQWPVASDTPADTDYSVSNGMVTDNVTGLTWQQVRTAGGKTYTYEDAQTMCQNLNSSAGSSGIGGCASGWRLPEIGELLSLVNLSGAAAPAIDPMAFPGTATSNFWTNTVFITHTLDSWAINFQDGTVTHSSIGSGFPAVCVRSPNGSIPGTPTAAGAPSGRYIIGNAGQSNGTVHDVVTGLTWQQTVATTATWSSTSASGSAQAYCASQNGAGLGGLSSGWRVPTLKELQSIVDLKATIAPVIDGTPFPNTPNATFWTSTLQGGAASANAWIVDFGDGTTGGAAIDFPQPVRCVH